MKTPLLLVCALFALTACDRQEEKGPTLDDLPVVAPLAKAKAAVSYRCEQDMPVTAIYGTDADGKPDVALVIKGQSYALTHLPAEKGERYGAPDVMTSGQGLVWWVEGNTARMFETPSENLADPDAGTLARTCNLKK